MNPADPTAMLGHSGWGFATGMARARRRVDSEHGGGAALLLAALAVGGCSERPLGATEPKSNLHFSVRFENASVERLDLLLVLDNSPGMAVKHQLLAASLPEIFGGLLGIICWERGRPTPSANGSCPPGSDLQESAIADLHVGVITTSLGGFGATTCLGEHEDDRGELVAPLRGVATPDDRGFFAWRGIPSRTLASELAPFAAEVAGLVAAVGEDGCGFEATLEAWYRFLIDPMPPVAWAVEGNYSEPVGINHTLLEQRSRFLRPDSAVAIVMLTDEDDCSFTEPQSHLFTDSSRGLPPGTSACALDPTDRCCRSCGSSESAPLPGCAPLAEDPNCREGFPHADPPNLRCYEQGRRFGLDLLAPTAKYSSALHRAQVYGRDCVTDEDCVVGSAHAPDGTCEPAGGARFCLFPNPILSSNPQYPRQVPRAHSGLTHLAGLVGVPWQDLATAATLDEPEELELRTHVAADSSEGLASRWPVILGDRERGEPPLDPFMWESIEPRLPGTEHPLLGRPFPEANPVTGDVVQPPDAPGAASPINGHEFTPSLLRDGLQYACTFPLQPARDCLAEPSRGCDCRVNELGIPMPRDSPLCQAEGSTTVTEEQRFAGARPGLRILDALKGYGMNGVVGSACPKVVDEAARGSPAFGYQAVFRALFDRRYRSAPDDLLALHERPAEDPAGSPKCRLVEVTSPVAALTCELPGRATPATEVEAVALRELETTGRCGEWARFSCTELTLCEIPPAHGEDLERCRAVPYAELPIGAGGYCLLDAESDRDGDGSASCVEVDGEPGAWQSEPDCLGDPALLRGLPLGRRHAVRVLSRGLAAPVPYPNSTVLLLCEGR